ncbi:MAG TPA: AAA family ATPase [Candidatus Deferrimicrobium sp.]|nr:AAA family ATPase [Candidatus Deferrimicrobium sp.]
MIEVQKLKRIPYGKTDFNDFKEKNLYYVDKTWFIRDIEEKGDFLFLIRPRRFGKSLFLGILEAYYDIALKDRFDFLFGETDIHKNPTPEKNSYLVLKLNFSMVTPEISRIEETFLDYIKESAYGFVQKYEKLLEVDLENANAAFSIKKNAAEVMVTLLRYCKIKERKIYVIIDEYDNFANIILSETGETEFKKITHGGGFLRAFFNVVKGGTTDTDAPISRFFMSGVSPITLDDVTSGFNIATNISLDWDINEILGFTQTEVETMIEYYRQTGKIRHSTPELIEMMSLWYNHYCFSLETDTVVFNSTQILYFFMQYLSRGKIPLEMVDNNIRFDYQKFRYLIIVDQKETLKTPGTNGNFSKLRQIIENGSIHSRIVKSFPINKIVSPENFISLLYYLGLLTIGGIDEENKAILKIPNESIKRLYYDYIKETYEETGVLTLNLSKYEDLMKEMAFKGKWKPLIEFLVQQMETSMGIRDLITREKAIQAFLNVYLGLSDLYLVSSEKELKKGYSDLALEPFLAQYPQLKYSYVIEIKYIKPLAKKKELTPEKIKEIKEAAAAQLNRYCLDDKFKKTIGHTVLKKLVLIFCGYRLVSHSEV